MLKYMLLGQLSYLPQTGYNLKQEIDQSTGFFWHAELSQIYRTLKQLEETGLVSSYVQAQEGRPDKRIYAITEAGQRALLDWLRAPLVEIEPVKDTLLLKLFFSRPLGKEAILTQLRIQLDLHRQLRALYGQPAADSIRAVADQYPHLALDAVLWEATRRCGESYVDMYIRWLEETLTVISRAFPDSDPVLDEEE